ncbi:MAG: hypothetical protein ABJG73_16405 [Tateyamaria sp.]|uniref:hypothetical protein n=1 Tax=Tateyamaria sp. TaxID=1929288 RepID=UPI00329A89B9
MCLDHAVRYSAGDKIFQRSDPWVAVDGQYYCLTHLWVVFETLVQGPFRTYPVTGGITFTYDVPMTA